MGSTKTDREKVLAKIPQAQYMNPSDASDGPCHCI
jgi:hypothetical protein